MQLKSFYLNSKEYKNSEDIPEEEKSQVWYDKERKLYVLSQTYYLAEDVHNYLSKLKYEEQ